VLAITEPAVSIKQIERAIIAALADIAIARLRAIETGRSVVNISTVGHSAIIAPDGSTIDSIAPYQPGAMVDNVQLSTTTTPATLFGKGIELLVSGLGVAGLVMALVGLLGVVVGRLLEASHPRVATEIWGAIGSNEAQRAFAGGRPHRPGFAQEDQEFGNSNADAEKGSAAEQELIGRKLKDQELLFQNQLDVRRRAADVYRAWDASAAGPRRAYFPWGSNSRTRDC